MKENVVPNVSSHIMKYQSVSSKENVTPLQNNRTLNRQEQRTQRKSDSKRLREQIDEFRRRKVNQSPKSSPGTPLVDHSSTTTSGLQVSQLQSAVSHLACAKTALEQRLSKADSSNEQLRVNLKESNAKVEFLQKMVQTQSKTINEIKKEKEEMMKRMKNLEANEQVVKDSFHMIQDLVIRLNSCTTKNLHGVQKSLNVDWEDLTETSNEMTEQVIQDAQQCLRENEEMETSSDITAIIKAYNALLLKELIEKGHLRITLNQLNAKYVKMMQDKEDEVKKNFDREEKLRIRPTRPNKTNATKAAKRWRLFKK